MYLAESRPAKAGGSNPKQQKHTMDAIVALIEFNKRNPVGWDIKEREVQ